MPESGRRLQLHLSGGEKSRIRILEVRSRKVEVLGWEQRW